MESKVGFVKSLFRLFDMVLISKNDLLLEKESLIEKLRIAENESIAHCLEVKNANKNILESSQKKSLDNYITERPMFIKGEINTINKILHEYKLSKKDGYVPGM